MCISPRAHVSSGACRHSVQFFESVFPRVPFQRPKMYSCIHRVRLQNSRRDRLQRESSSLDTETEKGKAGKQWQTMKTKSGKRPPSHHSHLRWPQGLTATYTAPAPTLGPRCPLRAGQSHSQGEPQGLWGINTPAWLSKLGWGAIRDRRKLAAGPMTIMPYNYAFLNFTEVCASYFVKSALFTKTINSIVHHRSPSLVSASLQKHKVLYPFSRTGYFKDIVPFLQWCMIFDGAH